VFLKPLVSTVRRYPFSRRVFSAVSPDQGRFGYRPLHQQWLQRGRSLPGNGLGLAIVTAISHLHGGTLVLEDAAPAPYRSRRSATRGSLTTSARAPVRRVVTVAGWPEPSVHCQMVIRRKCSR